MQQGAKDRQRRRPLLDEPRRAADEDPGSPPPRPRRDSRAPERRAAVRRGAPPRAARSRPAHGRHLDDRGRLVRTGRDSVGPSVTAWSAAGSATIVIATSAPRAASAGLTASSARAQRARQLAPASGSRRRVRARRRAAAGPCGSPSPRARQGRSCSAMSSLLRRSGDPLGAVTQGGATSQRCSSRLAPELFLRDLPQRERSSRG